MYLVFPVHCPRLGVCERGKIAEDKCQNRNFSTYLGGEKTARRKEADEAQKVRWFIGGTASRRGRLASVLSFSLWFWFWQYVCGRLMMDRPGLFWIINFAFCPPA
jgi:hypothetical protein